MIPAAERAQYIADWSQPGALTAMLNWYRGSQAVVPPPGDRAAARLAAARFSEGPVPTLVIWGMKDKALLPVQLDGLDELVDDLTIVRCRTPAISRRGKRRTRSPPRSSPSLPAMRRLLPRRHEPRPVPVRAPPPASPPSRRSTSRRWRARRRRACSRNSTTTGSARRSRMRNITRPSVDFFDDIVTGADARRAEIDALIAAGWPKGWSLERLDRPMRAILRAGAYELIARADVPVGSVISEYVDVAHAFYDKRESGFVNGLLDAIAKEARARAQG
jgi:transcription antitermination factor NusB